MKAAAAFILAFAFLSSTSNAHTPKTAPRLTGKMLVDYWFPPPGAKNAFDRDARTVANFNLAQGFIDGVVDATQGTAWCHDGKIKPDELDAYAMWELRKLPSNALADHAAPLLIEALGKKFPCSSKSEETK